MPSAVSADGTTASGSAVIDEIVREGTRRMPTAAPEAEVNRHSAKLADERDDAQVANTVTVSASAVQAIGSSGSVVHVKRTLANLAVVALDRLEAPVRDRLQRLQYRSATLDGTLLWSRAASLTYVRPNASAASTTSPTVIPNHSGPTPTAGE